MAFASVQAWSQAKEKVIVVSWGDLVGDKRFVGVAQLDTPDKMTIAAKAWKAKGVGKVLFRVDDFRLLNFHDLYVPPGNPYNEWKDAVTKAWESNLLTSVVKEIKAAGMEVQMWISVVDEGCAPSVFYNDVVPFPWQSRFVKAHPEMQSADRSLTESGRKYHEGVLEFAYPEVRAHVLEQIRFFSDRYAFDGVFLSYRSHSPPPPHADQFGFNAPVVEEYQRRYGKNILRQNFDLEKWRSLRGEYFTQFLREVRAYLNTKGQKLSLGVPQGEHAGPPIGNIALHWRTWVQEKLVDDLIVGHHTLQRATY
ncbi:MAG: family 10 glycosylhydrolase, partial [Opitutaceae bacterium]|nr:family 10 glycosylhydrolase [Opitutaceae bacterium]